MIDVGNKQAHLLVFQHVGQQLEEAEDEPDHHKSSDEDRKVEQEGAQNVSVNDKEERHRPSVSGVGAQAKPAPALGGGRRTVGFRGFGSAVVARSQTLKQQP